MLKKEITYTDFDGNQVTETLYFNLTKSELFEYEHSRKSGLAAYITSIMEAGDTAAVIAEFKKIVLMSYGRKSADGRSFMKSEEIRQEFEFSAAFDAIFVELAQSETSVAEFIIGIVPAEMEAPLRKEMAPPAPPAPPSPPAISDEKVG